MFEAEAYCDVRAFECIRILIEVNRMALNVISRQREYTKSVGHLVTSFFGGLVNTWPIFYSVFRRIIICFFLGLKSAIVIGI